MVNGVSKNTGFANVLKDLLSLTESSGSLNLKLVDFKSPNVLGSHLGKNFKGKMSQARSEKCQSCKLANSQI